MKPLLLDTYSVVDGKLISLKHESKEGELLEIKNSSSNFKCSIMPLLQGHGLMFRFSSRRKSSHFPLFFFPEAGKEIQEIENDGKYLIRKGNFYFLTDGISKFDGKYPKRRTDDSRNELLRQINEKSIYGGFFGQKYISTELTGRDVNAYIGFDDSTVKEILDSDFEKITKRERKYQKLLYRRITASNKDIQKLDNKYVDKFVTDVMILRCLQNRYGGISASYGFTQEGYQDVWGRDLFFMLKALKECDMEESYKEAIDFLEKAQIKSKNEWKFSELHIGRWPQRMAIDGKPSNLCWDNRDNGLKNYQPDDQLCFPLSLLIDEYLSGNKKVDKNIQLSIKALEEDLKNEMECDGWWEDKYGRNDYPTPFSELVSYLHVLLKLESLDKRFKEKTDSIFNKIMEFWDEKRQLFIRDLREKEKVYDSAALYIDPILEYIEKRNKNGLIVKIKKHILSQINGLKKKADSRIMLKRYEGDVWLGNEKVWTLSTLIGAYSCIKLASFLRERKDKDWEIFLKEGKQLLDTTIDIKFLPEQLTEDGNADSANPLGWSHAMRILTIKGLSKFQ